MKFSETSIPVNYSLDLKSTRMMDWAPEDADKIYSVFTASMSKFLANVKSKDAKSVALILNDLKGNFMMAGVVEYHENENPDLPGNWSYTMTFNEDDVKEVGTKFLTTETQFVQIVANVAHNLHGMRFVIETYIHDMFIVAIDTLKKYLDENASEEAIDVTLDGYFVASAGIEDGKKVFAIVPSESMKVLIKEDIALA